MYASRQVDECMDKQAFEVFNKISVWYKSIKSFGREEEEEGEKRKREVEEEEKESKRQTKPSRRSL